MRYNIQVWRLVEGGLGTQSTSGQDEVHKREGDNKKMTTEGHCRGSEEIHNKRKNKESQEEYNRDFLELARDILCFEKHMQATEEENERYGWVMKRDVIWNSLQVKLQQNMFDESKKELREVESEMEV